ncbi:MAG: flagellar hook capping protein, partial [Lachnospiraceae bacterium]|nr:flagellar hook capping protein [Lachnospiraceae bacterium]
SSTSLSKSRETNSSGMDSDAFLSLLVAEMQNQDPLQPTSNTEWVSQYATFTEVSEIQGIADSMGTVQAQGLVGQHVIMKVTGNDGETNYVDGKVDYVVYENGKAYLSIKDNLYSIDDLDTVADNEYMEAYEIGLNVASLLKNLPDVDDITIVDEAKIKEITDITDNLNDYQKSFLQDSIFEKIDEYKEKMKQLKEGMEAEENDEDDAGDSE